MATTRSFNDMLNQYLPDSLLREELIKRDYILTRVEKDDGWKGGTLIVPFEGTRASTVEFGSLAAANDIAEYDYVRGTVSDYIEQWGSLIFNQRDLYEHGQGLNEKTFLRMLPDQVEQFMSYMKQVTSVQLGTGPHFAGEAQAGATTNSDFANGIVEVDRVDRFYIGQKVTLDDATLNQDLYVIAININDSTVTLSTSRGGAADDLTAGTAFTQGAISGAARNKFYHPGADVSSFQSITDALLSLANGGSTNLHGVAKTAWPHLQAVNIDGSSIDESNILDKLFDAYTDVRKKAKGNANEILMSYKNLGSVMKLIEVQKGGFKVTPTAQKASEYGWTEIELTSVKGALKIVGIQEWDDDTIAFIDWSALKFHSNGMFRKRSNPDTGMSYFEVRNTTGFQYIVDVSLFGELVVKKPGHCAIIHSISY